MKLEDQVCTLEQSKKLKEFGVRQFSLFYHIDNIILGSEGIRQRNYINNINNGTPIDAGVVRYYSAFTGSELGVMLGKYWEREILIAYEFETNNEAIKRAHILIGALQTNQITSEECNNRIIEN